MQDQEPAAKPGLSSAAQGIYVLSAKRNWNNKYWERLDREFTLLSGYHLCPK